MRARRIPATPLGLPPVAVACSYFAICCLGGGIIGATEPLKVLLRMRGTFSTLEDPEGKLTDALNLGFSLSVSLAVLGGVINDRAGPKVLAVMSHLCCALGFFVMFSAPKDSYVHVAAGICLIGCTYHFISTSHASLGALFPGRAPLAIATLSIGCEVSTCIPTILRVIVQSSRASVDTVVYGYCLLCLAVASAELVLVPRSPFTAPSESEEIQPFSNEAALLHGPSKNKFKRGRQPEVANMASWPLKRQMANRVYAVITLFSCANMFRRQHYTQLVRQINETVALKSGGAAQDGQTVTDVYGLLLPTSAIGGLMNGLLTTRLGPVAGVYLVNSYATFTFLLSSIPVLWMQYITIFFINMFGSYMFGLVYAYIAAYFGYATLGTLQGTATFLCGMCGLLFTPFNTYVVGNLPDVLWANRMLLVFSLAVYLLPTLLLLKAPKTENAYGETDEGADMEDSLAIQDIAEMEESLAIQEITEKEDTRVSLVDPSPHGVCLRQRKTEMLDEYRFFYAYLSRFFFGMWNRGTFQRLWLGLAGAGTQRQRRFFPRW